ncbi:MAG: hypothetical protein ACRDDY_12285 [Clostridium sp.]|uniref:hypothetical protein n=1 Tax=Clostridium sp. TaxID=1506 RepID=UPI003EE80857
MFKTQQDKRSLRDLRQGLKAKKSLEVEIMSLSTGEIFYECPKTRYKFNLAKLGSKESIELDILVTLANRYRGFFESHLITIVDFEDDEYSVEDLKEYLGIKDIYTGIENTDVDYVAEILDMDNYNFEKFISTDASPMLVSKVAERAIYLYMKGKFDSHSKRRILSKALGLEDIFDVADAELDSIDKE